MTARERSGSGSAQATMTVQLDDAAAAMIAERVAELAVSRLSAPQEGYLTAEDAATYLACPKSRIYDLAKQQRVRHLRDGRRLLFRRADLDAALREVEPR